MTLPLHVPYMPMEPQSADEIPKGPNWQYEPKWDGFRCIVFRDGEKVQLQSKAAQPLARYFPDLVSAFLEIKAKRFVLDGEIVSPEGKAISFDALLQRIHPAATRIARLAAETPASFIAFDFLVDDANREYLSGRRDGMVKIKRRRSVDCVIGGFRYASKGKIVGSILLGLYDGEGLLHHVGFCSSFNAQQKKELTPKLEALIKPPGFTGQAPGGPSRWSTERSAEWMPLAPRLVVEVQYDHFTGGRFRHGTRFIRWRPDKAPKQCTMDQLQGEKSSPLKLLTRK